MPYFKRHPTIIITLAAIVVLIAAILARSSGKSSQPQTAEGQTRVNFINAKDYQKDNKTVSAYGSVQSLQQVDLKSQVGGQITKVNVSVGSKVSTGQVLVALGNSDLAAQLAEAEASLKIQQANLDQLNKGAKSEDVRLAQAQVDAASKALTDTQSQQKINLANAFSAMMNAGLAAIPSSTNISSATVSVSGTYNSSSQGTYIINIYQTGNGPAYSVSGLEANISSAITRGAPQPIGTQGLSITFSTNGTINPSDSWAIAVPNTQSTTYASSYNAYLAAQTQSQQAINAAQSALDVAKKTLELKKSSATPEQLNAQQGSVDAAAAAVALVRAQLSKTIFVSAISGTVSAISAKFGELLSPGQLVASIVNNNGMEVKAFVSNADLALVSLGAQTTIAETAKGIVTNVAPSIDPQNKTAEVDIAVQNPQNSGLTIGQNVAVRIASNNSGTGNYFLLPIQTVKITQSKDAYVYTANANSEVEEHKVTLGNVVGEQIEVLGGVTPDMKLISSAYELNAGQKVSQ